MICHQALIIFLSLFLIIEIIVLSVPFVYDEFTIKDSPAALIIAMNDIKDNTKNPDIITDEVLSVDQTMIPINENVDKRDEILVTSYSSLSQTVPIDDNSSSQKHK